MAKVVLIALLIVSCGGGGTATTSSTTVDNTPSLSSDKSFLQFSLRTNESGSQRLFTGEIDGNNITFNNVDLIDISNLVAIFTLDGVAEVTVQNILQINNQTANNFSQPVTYVVRAEDGSTKTYTVTVNRTSDRAFQTFQLVSNQDDGSQRLFLGEIIGNNININNVDIADVSNLVANFTVNGVATVLVGNNVQTSGSSTNDFTQPVTYTVRAPNGNVRSYVVTVNRPSDRFFQSFRLRSNESAGQRIFTGEIVGNNININNVDVADLSNMVALFTLNGSATVTVADIPQVSDTSINNFSQQVAYVVRAPNGSIRTYTVTVNRSANNSIQSFRLVSANDQIFDGVISEQNHTITVPVPFFATGLMTAEFTTNGARSVTLDSREQLSGVSDLLTLFTYTQQLVYRVTAFDGNSQDYTLILTRPNPGLITHLFSLNLIFPVDITITADSKFAYVLSLDGSDNFLSQFRIDNGNLVSIAESIAHGNNGSDLFLTPNNHFLYVAKSGGLSRYAVNTQTGLLTFESDIALSGTVVDMVFSSDGTFAYVYNASNNLLTFAVDSNGNLTQLSTMAAPISQFAGGTQLQIIHTPGLDLLYANYTSSPTCKIAVYAVTPLPSSAGEVVIPCGSMVVSPDGNFVYIGNSVSISVYPGYDGGAPIGSRIENIGTRGSDGLTISPDGQTLYSVSTSENFVQVYSRNVNDGTLATSVLQFAAFGETPYQIFITPHGKFAYVLYERDILSGVGIN